MEIIWALAKCLRMENLKEEEEEEAFSLLDLLIARAYAEGNVTEVSLYAIWAEKEAAVLDGANIIQQIKTVEWPAIKDTVLIQFIMSVGNIMSVGFEKAYALQTDLNMNASEIISTYVYKKGLLDGDYGFSTAVGLFNTVINVILLISMNSIVKKMNDGKGV